MAELSAVPSQPRWPKSTRFLGNDQQQLCQRTPSLPSSHQPPYQRQLAIAFCAGVGQRRASAMQFSRTETTETVSHDDEISAQCDWSFPFNRLAKRIRNNQSNRADPMQADPRVTSKTNPKNHPSAKLYRYGTILPIDIRRVTTEDLFCHNEEYTADWKTPCQTQSINRHSPNFANLEPRSRQITSQLAKTKAVHEHPF